MKELIKKRIKKEKAITLIALVITVIVLLILAGVTVATLTGDNGLITKAGEARNTNIEAEGLERIQLAVMASHDNRGINTTTLAKNLSEIDGLTDTNNQAITKNTDLLLPAVIRINNTFYKIKENGDIEKMLYQYVEYIESTGTQFIDTEYIPKINTELHLEVSFNGTFDVTKGGSTNIFSTQNKNGEYFFSLNFGGGKDQANMLFSWVNKGYGRGGNICNFIINDNIKTNRNLIVMRSGYINYGTAGRSLDIKTADNDNSLILFANADKNPISCYNMKVYSLKFYEGETLIRNYVPCRKIETGEIGLHEKLEEKFYTNQGTGEFIAGPEVY